METKVDILGFYGDDRNAAWDEAMALAELLESRNATDRLRVRAELQRGMWVVTATHIP